MKYINIKDFGMILFPSTEDHSVMFHKLFPNRDKEDIIGAGTVLGDPEAINCFGESWSLKVKCDKKQDNAELKFQVSNY